MYVCVFVLVCVEREKARKKNMLLLKTKGTFGLICNTERRPKLKSPLRTEAERKKAGSSCGSSSLGSFGSFGSTERSEE